MRHGETVWTDPEESYQEKGVIRNGRNRNGGGTPDKSNTDVTCFILVRKLAATSCNLSSGVFVKLINW